MTGQTLTSNGRVFLHVVLAVIASLINLAAAMLTFAALGALEPWSSVQFVGLFGLIELGMGFAFIFGPNLWRLPVQESETGDSTEPRLTASRLMTPHWIALAKAAAGAGMLVAAAVAEGVSPATAAVLPAAFLIGALLLAVSAVVARIGVARPGLDVWFLTVRRAGGRELAFPGLSAGGVAMQLLSNLAVYPAAAFLRPSALYQPHVAISAGLLAGLLLAACASCAAAWLAWRGRASWRAPAKERQKAEAELSARTG